MSPEPEDHFEKGVSETDWSRPMPALEQNIRKLVEEPVAVLCTQGEGQPYGSLVFFAFSDDLRCFAFATPRATRKYRLVKECDSVALLLDTRMKFPEDMMKVEAVPVTGRASEVTDDPELKRLTGLLAGRHPYIESFIAAPSTALFRVDVVRYIHVSRFQEVRQWIPSR
jgi:nitroimidazol reductase NimA-like FMN-containing flavoprotein (pyridoxamine 5'-phosphate oxidase superfamily)